MAFKKYEKVLHLNDRLRLALSNHETKNGEGWRIRQEGTGKGLPPLSSVERLIAEGFVRVDGSKHKEPFVWADNTVRVPTGELNDQGKAACRLVPDGTRRATVTLSLRDGKETVRMTLSFRQGSDGRWMPTIQVSRPTGGTRGAAKQAPVSEDELF